MRGGERLLKWLSCLSRVQAEVQIHGAALKVVEGLSP